MTAGDGAQAGSESGAERPENSGEEARERARRKARLDRIFRGAYPGQAGAGDDGFSARHYDEQRPPHHGG